MPEGPEIRLAADAIAAAIVGRPTTGVTFAFDHLKHYEPALTGEVVTAIDTYGKAIVTRFANDLNIYSHNQLYGRWMIRASHDYPETNRQLRLAIHNAAHSALLYSASEIEVLPAGEIAEHPFIRRLGPDVLRPEVSAAQVVAQFAADRFVRRRLHSLLLDQGFLAGLGNYLRSEILFVAGVHPDRRPVDCNPAQIEALAGAAIELTRRSYRTRGITTAPDLAARLKAAGVPWRAYRWWVFGREDQPCHQCATPIVKTTRGGRRLYLCPTCQPDG